MLILFNVISFHFICEILFQIEKRICVCAIDNGLLNLNSEIALFFLFEWKILI